MISQIVMSSKNQIRGVKVMLDYDLAAIYGVETRSLNQAVKRNMERFPQDFMFRLTENEWDTVKRNSLSDSMPSQIVIASPDRRNKSAPPYAFTEHGAVMLASVLRSPRLRTLKCFLYSMIS
ncbi:MAG: ORF6N domain-containing protein [Bacteroidales bacterium]|nr:ORF6N domain-containing protein [Bacteroidales bacterium]